MADNTVFDSVFKTMVHKAPQLMVPFINEAFGRNYPPESTITPFSNEHETPSGSIIDDSVFRLGDKIYHVECQSTSDTSMVVRMIEYDFAIALEQALSGGAPYEINFPSSCVLFLRNTSKTPDALQMKVNLPDGGSFLYSAKVVKAQRYNSDDIFEKGLLLLLPFYLMRYEKALSQIANDEVRTARLVEECVALHSRLATAVLTTGDRLLYEELVELIIRVSDYIMSQYDTLRTKVRGAMGGQVLELLNDRAERLEREAREEGRKEGRKEGREEGVQSLATQLKERGIDEQIIAEAIASLTPEEEPEEADENQGSK
ncbi:MAG: hypothetical protein IKG18_15410 [Atopobiaceae bacterium]|nr:hypothetical protein [Atopobiaceae bacterium]